MLRTVEPSFYVGSLDTAQCVLGSPNRVAEPFD